MAAVKRIVVNEGGIMHDPLSMARGGPVVTRIDKEKVKGESGEKVKGTVKVSGMMLTEDAVLVWETSSGNEYTLKVKLGDVLVLTTKTGTFLPLGQAVSTTLSVISADEMPAEHKVWLKTFKDARRQARGENPEEDIAS